MLAGVVGKSTTDVALVFVLAQLWLTDVDAVVPHAASVENCRLSSEPVVLFFARFGAHVMVIFCSVYFAQLVTPQSLSFCVFFTVIVLVGTGLPWPF